MHTRLQLDDKTKARLPSSIYSSWISQSECKQCTYVPSMLFSFIHVYIHITYISLEAATVMTYSIWILCNYNQVHAYECMSEWNSINPREQLLDFGRNPHLHLRMNNIQFKILSPNCAFRHETASSKDQTKIKPN